MQNGELFFTGDQVINFDDLGQFKDFTQDIEKMIQNLLNVNNQKENLNAQLLHQILKADPDDTFHIPSFKELMKALLNLLQQKPQVIEQSKAYRKTLQSIFAVLEQSFLSFSFSQDIGPQIIKYIKSKQAKKNLNNLEVTYILNFLLRMSDKASYIDNVQLFSSLILAIDQLQILQMDQQKQNTCLCVYINAMDLYLNSSKIRKSLSKQIQNEQNDKYLYLKFKIFLWQKNMQSASTILKILQGSKINNFDIGKTTFKYWKKRINQSK